MSSFSGTNSSFGNFSGNVIDIDAMDIGKAFEALIARGSKMSGVTVDDISVAVTALPDNPESIKIKGLTDLGMPLFDAVVWKLGKGHINKPLKVNPELDTKGVVPTHEINRALFYVYFFLLTQARYPVVDDPANAPKVPNFLSKIMQMTEGQSVYMRKICSFEPNKFDPTWIKYVKITGFSKESISRFGLGVAGYRMFNPFKLYSPKDGVSDNLLDAVSFAKEVAESAPTWAIHPLTRDPAVLTKRGNLNKNLGNLILDVFTDEQITEMVTAKILYAKPQREPGFRNYLTWQSHNNISGTEEIFRS